MFKFVNSCVSDLVQNVSKLSVRNCSSLLSNRPITRLLAPGTNSLAPENLRSSLLINPKPELNQVRHNWGYKDRMMIKDIKRRELLRKFAPERIRLQSLRANTILPKVLKKSAEEQLQSLTKHSTLGYITNRCSLTSKAGGCLHRWRLSRHSWRTLADYNQMSGVIRSTWGVPSRNSAMFTFRKQKKSWFNYDGYRMISYTDKLGSERKKRFQI